MTLYFVRAQTDNNLNMDLFVHAKSPQHALIDWKLYYDGWDMPEAAIVYDPTGPALAGSVLTWDAIPRTAFTL